MSTKSSDCFVIGIGGVTGGGKSTLANSLHKYLPNSQVMCQDEYFYPKYSPHHVKVKGLDHVNYDIVTALDMDRMHTDILNICKTERNGKINNDTSNNHLQNGKQNDSLHNEQNGNLRDQQNGVHGDHKHTKFQEKKVLILEGFCILNYKPITDLCDLKFSLFLTREECVNRRNLRNYDPPDIPGYFDLCVWPEYLNFKKEIENQGDVILLDGTKSNLLEVVINHMNKPTKELDT